MHALFVFAHQDDEIAAASRIAYALRRGLEVSCVYLTNGEGRQIASHVRDDESRAMLGHLGVDLRRVHFAGSEERIPDGRLFEHLERALALLEQKVPEPVDELACLAWEGGHQDHDASHLIAVAFARRRGILDRTLELPLYQGYRMRGPFFQTLAPLRVGGAWTGRGIRIAEGLRIAALCWFYRSQRKTWLGLMPPALLRLVIGHQEWTRPVDLARLQDKPHEGLLFYERRFGVSWEEFSRYARPFVAARITGS
jgi:LmbE family N-acetylglucosaminyl deacetylase